MFDEDCHGKNTANKSATAGTNRNTGGVIPWQQLEIEIWIMKFHHPERDLVCNMSSYPQYSVGPTFQKPNKIGNKSIPSVGCNVWTCLSAKNNVLYPATVFARSICHRATTFSSDAVIKWWQSTPFSKYRWFTNHQISWSLINPIQSSIVNGTYSSWQTLTHWETPSGPSYFSQMTQLLTARLRSKRGKAPSRPQPDNNSWEYLKRQPWSRDQRSYLLQKDGHGILPFKTSKISCFLNLKLCHFLAPPSPDELLHIVREN